MSPNFQTRSFQSAGVVGIQSQTGSIFFLSQNYLVESFVTDRFNFFLLKTVWWKIGTYTKINVNKKWFGFMINHNVHTGHVQCASVEKLSLLEIFLIIWISSVHIPIKMIYIHTHLCNSNIDDNSVKCIFLCYMH